MTDWLTIVNGNIGSLCGNFPYVNQIWMINISSNSITEICNHLLEQIIEGTTTTWLDLSRNKILKLSPKIKQGRFEKIWLSGNEFVCNCDMLWMASWLANTTTLSGDHVIQDYKHVLCYTGKHTGTPIYTLDAALMDCLPTRLPASLWAHTIVYALF